MSKVQHTDGGRSTSTVSHYKPKGDCVCRAITIATGEPYSVVWAVLLFLSEQERNSKRRRRSHPDRGVHRRTYEKYLRLKNWVWTPTMFVGSGCKVHLKASELPSGRLIARCSRHLVAVIDGVIHDTHDPARNGTRCVYGYWQPPSNQD